ncbi:hypothetical protein [Pseudomonas hunanensis]|uniref:hypothetical protein n=1 Tax=Pseudomonas hunanensis TaxID=1247546 RepID=UPI0037F39977
MQRMTVNLRDLLGGLRDGVVQIASAAEELSAITEQTSAGVSSQKVETDQVATTMNEMASTVQDARRLPMRRSMPPMKRGKAIQWSTRPSSRLPTWTVKSGIRLRRWLNSSGKATRSGQCWM